jgi:flagella basal body P-ring formation protein FlgA
MRYVDQLLVSLLLCMAAVNTLAAPRAPASATASGASVQVPAVSEDRLKAELLSRIRVWVADQWSTPLAAVVFPPIDARLRVQACPGDAVLDFPFASRDLVRARCDAPAWQLFIKVEVHRPRSVVVFARAVSEGAVLGEGDLAMQAIIDPASDALDDPTRAVGRIARRAASAGAVVEARMLEERVRIFRSIQPLSAGAPMTAASLRSEWIPRAAVPPGAAASLELEGSFQMARDVPAGHLIMAIDVSSSRQVLVARQGLAAGRLIEPGMVELRYLPAAGLGAGVISDPRTVEQSEVIRSLQPGELVRTSDIRPALLVHRGDEVLLTLSSSGSIEVSVKAEALQDARLGERVQLKNLESGRPLVGVVTGRNAARGP